MAKMSSLFAVFLLMVSLSDHFANCFGNIGPEISDVKPGCARNKCGDPSSPPKPRKCALAKPTQLDNDQQNKCDFLVTMTRYEFLLIVDCIATNGDYAIQNAKDACNMELFPEKARNAFLEHSKKYFGASCGPQIYEVLATDPVSGIAVFDSMSDSIKDYTPEETKQQIAYENCLRKVVAAVIGNA